MRVLVCGGRTYNNRTLMEETLNRFNKEGSSLDLIITGGASGADALAAEIAFKWGTPLAIYPAQWDSYGKGAGPIRNGWMLEFGQPDLVVAFSGGRGTANMIKQAREAGVNVMEIKEQDG